MWRVERFWTSVITSGDEIYFTEQGSLDVLGNPLPGDEGKEALWKARYPDAAPTRIAALDGTHNTILARVHDKTYIEQYPKLLVVSDGGTVTERELPGGTHLAQVADSGVYFVRSDTGVARIALDEDGALLGDAEDVLPPQTGFVRNLFTSDRLWLQLDEEVCAYDLADLSAAPICNGLGPFGGVFSVGQGTAFISDTIIPSIGQWEITNDTWRNLYKGDDRSSVSPTVAGDFIYSWLTEFTMPQTSMLVRIPTVGPAELPTALISEEVANAAVLGQAAFGSGVVSPQVTSEGVYWQQPRNSELSRYIFRLPRE